MLPGKRTDFSDKTYSEKASVKVRLIRIELPGSETEILITSLLDSKKYPHKIFKDLYFINPTSI